MFVPIVLGSDKTVVSVGTGNTEYHPLYLSIGNVHNGARRAHRDAMVVIRFLAQPKGQPGLEYDLLPPFTPLFSADKQDADQENFRLFKRQIFHSSLAKILDPLKPAMTKPELTKCWDGHYRKAIYGLGPYIADYQEQVLVTGVVQGWCAKCLTLPDQMEQCGITRTYEHTQTVIEAFGLQVAWNEYGISGDIKV